MDSNSSDDTPLSPMPNVGTSILSECATFLAHFTLSASLDEKITLMEGFTSTLLWTSAESIRLETAASLMWTDVIRMCSLAKKHRRRCGITRRKMEMLWLGDSSDQTEADFLRLAMSGMKSSWLTLEMSFSNYVESWHLDNSLVAFLPSANMQTGNIDWILHPTDTTTASSLARTRFQNSMIGFQAIWTDISLDDVEGLLF
nr:MAG: rep protein [Cressdnaviricota sp.]